MRDARSGWNVVCSTPIEFGSDRVGLGDNCVEVRAGPRSPRPLEDGPQPLFRLRLGQAIGQGTFKEPPNFSGGFSR